MTLEICLGKSNCAAEPQLAGGKIATLLSDPHWWVSGVVKYSNFQRLLDASVKLSRYHARRGTSFELPCLALKILVCYLAFLRPLRSLLKPPVSHFYLSEILLPKFLSQFYPFLNQKFFSKGFAVLAGF
jgi:hypothetical protein